MDTTAVASTAAAVIAVPSYAIITVHARPVVARWWLPAVPMAAFAGWTTYAVLDGGPLGFWSEHVGTPWETQIWMDLLLMAGVAWFALQPRLRRHGIRPWPWLLVVLATGSIHAGAAQPTAARGGNRHAVNLTGRAP
jgi:hypothetical protein